jgi:hypothetical protein
MACPMFKQGTCKFPHKIDWCEHGDHCPRYQEGKYCRYLH